MYKKLVFLSLFFLALVSLVYAFEANPKELYFGAIQGIAPTPKFITLTNSNVSITSDPWIKVTQNFLSPSVPLIVNIDQNLIAAPIVGHHAGNIAIKFIDDDKVQNVPVNIDVYDKFTANPESINLYGVQGQEIPHAYSIINDTDVLTVSDQNAPWLSTVVNQGCQEIEFIADYTKVPASGTYSFSVKVLSGGQILKTIPVKLIYDEPLKLTVSPDTLTAVSGKPMEFYVYIISSKPITKIKYNAASYPWIKEVVINGTVAEVFVDTTGLSDANSPYNAEFTVFTIKNNYAEQAKASVNLVIEETLKATPDSLSFSAIENEAPPAAQIVTVNKPITNITYQDNNHPDWLKVQQVGTAILVSVDHKNWATMTHNSGIIIHSGNIVGNKEKLEIPVSLTVDPPLNNSNTPPAPVPFSINKDNITFNVIRGGNSPAYESIWANQAYSLPSDLPNWLMINQVNLEGIPWPLLEISVNMNLLPEYSNDFYGLVLTSNNGEQKFISIYLNIQEPEIADDSMAVIQDEIVDSALRDETEQQNENRGDRTFTEEARKAPDDQIDLIPEQLITSPEIVSINPAAAPAGTGITIIGSNFDAQPGANYVYFGNITNKASIVSWSSQEIKAVVPYLIPGNYDVKVVKLPDTNDLSKALESNPAAFSITALASVGEAVIYPNPYNPNNGNVTIAYDKGTAASIGLYIYDMTARVVHHDTTANASITWNGRASSNDLVGNGVYLVRVVDDNSKQLIAKGKLLVIKQ